MNYEQILARQPASTVKDRNAAREYVELLGAQLEAKDTTLTDSQRRYLYKQRRIWQDRADGKDERWNERGTQPGRPSKPKAHRPGRGFRRDEDDDPLLASIMRKFGKPLGDEQ